MTTQLKARFCPSPTGLVHLGNVRTALFNALLAYGHKGIFLLRIEDTDKERSKPEFTELLMEDLRWLGLQWQEGPEHEMGHGPYWQSQRQPIYDRYYGQLEAQGIAYPCFCSEQQLALARKLQRAAGKPPRYPGTCRNLTKEQVDEKIAKGLTPVLRFAVPLNQTIVFTDLVRGEQRFQSNDLGDFIIRRTDGTSPFMFCNAIDDALMGVTHALRGEDHLTNTPRQIMILEALKLTIPHYGHINLIVGSDGAPLSKRHGSRSVQELKQEGFLPIAVVNYLARLGHYYQDESFMSFAELSQKFAVENLGRAPARYDANQLLYWQKEAINRLDDEGLWQWMGPSVHALVPVSARHHFMSAIKTNICFPVDAEHWAKIFFADELSINQEHQTLLQQATSKFFEVAADAVRQNGADFAAVSSALKEQLAVTGKALFQPLRVALTGELHGPEMVKIFTLLGAEKIQKRLRACCKSTTH
jgi:glutamyl-tRNA synthetase